MTSGRRLISLQAPTIIEDATWLALVRTGHLVAIWVVNRYKPWSVGHPDSQIDFVAFRVSKSPPPRRVLVTDHAASGSNRGSDAAFDLVVREVNVDVNPVALRAGCIHLLEPECRPASQRVEYILGTDFVPVFERSGPEDAHAQPPPQMGRQSSMPSQDRNCGPVIGSVSKSAMNGTLDLDPDSPHPDAK